MPSDPSFASIVYFSTKNDMAFTWLRIFSFNLKPTVVYHLLSHNSSLFRSVEFVLCSTSFYHPLSCRKTPVNHRCNRSRGSWLGFQGQGFFLTDLRKLFTMQANFQISIAFYHPWLVPSPDSRSPTRNLLSIKKAGLPSCVGNPAIRTGSVVFRPRVSTGLAFSTSIQLLLGTPSTRFEGSYPCYRLSHIKFHRVIGRRRITIQPPPSGLVKFNMWKSI
jgi:hypothetical protein